MTSFSRRLGTLGVFAVMASLGCDSSTPTATSFGPDGTDGPTLGVKYANPEFDPSNFVSTITNPFLPLTRGTTFHYRSETPDGVELNDVSVTRDAKTILGVQVTVLHDVVSVDGEVTEDTFDWLAQDRAGNVWYFGEDTKTFDNGVLVSTQGSWEAGVGDNRPGIIMLAQPKTGLTYQQEIAPGVAEDVARVLSLKSKVAVPYGSFTGCLQTMESTPLEHGNREHKFYCRGVGLVLEVQPREGRVKNELIGIAHF